MRDQRDAIAQRADHEGQIGGVVGEVVVAARADPVGVAVAAPVEREDVMAGGGELRRHQVPGVRMLQESVEQQHDRPVVAPLEQVVPQPVGDDESGARAHRFAASTTTVPAGGSSSTPVDSSRRATSM